MDGDGRSVAMLAVAQDLGQKVTDDIVMLMIVFVDSDDLCFGGAMIRLRHNHHRGDG